MKPYLFRAMVGASVVASACTPSPEGDTGTLPPATAPSNPVVKAPAEPAPPELVFPEDEAFRAQQPSPAALKPFQQPPVTHFKLKNGIEVHLVEAHQLPTVALEIVFEGGSSNDGPGKEGESSLCMSLLGEGTKKLDTIAYAEALADLASVVTSVAGVDQQSVGLKSLTKNLDATLDIWVDTLRAPGLRAQDFDRLVKQRLDSLKQEKSSPAAVAARVSSSIFWGEAHPFAKIATEASIGSLKLADCQRHQTDYLRPVGASLYAVGDISQKEIEDKIGSRLATWKGAPKKFGAIGKGVSRAGKVFFIDVPGATQSVVLLGHLGPARLASDYFPTWLMGSILGGGFTSRINMNIREAKGWAYGARGGFTYWRAGSVFGAGGQIKAENTLEAAREVFDEIKHMREADVSAAELDREKDGAILGLPERFATSREVLATYRGMRYFGLPLDYFATYVKNVAKLDKDAVRTAAMTHLHPDGLRFVVVGDAGAEVNIGGESKERVKLRDGLATMAKELGGAFVELDTDGRVKP